MATMPPNFRPHRPRGGVARPASTDPERVERVRGRRGVRERREFFRKHPLCAVCLSQGRTTAAQEVDHIVPLSRGGSDDDANKQAICVECHLQKTAQESGIRKGGRLSTEVAELRMPSGLKPSGVPLTIVCGPPGGGKSTFVRERAGPDDLVIDLDEIKHRLSGEPVHQVSSRWIRPALAERNRQLRALAGLGGSRCAYFIVSAPEPAERRQWAQRLGGKLVICAPPLDECIRRIRADPTRGRSAERMVGAAADWWARNAQPDWEGVAESLAPQERTPTTPRRAYFR